MAQYNKICNLTSPRSLSQLPPSVPTSSPAPPRVPRAASSAGDRRRTHPSARQRAPRRRRRSRRQEASRGERLFTGTHTTRHVSVEIRPARQSSAHAVIYSRRHESHPVRPADGFHINNRTLLSHDDAAAHHQVAHGGVRGRHPRSPIRSVARGREPPRRLRRSARLARLTSLENAERLRRELGLGRRLAGALR